MKDKRGKNEVKYNKSELQNAVVGNQIKLLNTISKKHPITALIAAF